ncbi:MAG TPA: DNA-directed RNA polymerase subunit D [Candidatus Bathyarchaeota archaeon]|nr:DNA-directed RNA polymerase subunit D [Candidatus Bathyarchaeota archaeon]
MAVEEGDLRSRGGESLKTTIVSLTEDTVRFLIEGVDTAFVNALRRTMVSEVPTMTIEDIFYFDNSSLVPDEILANRIGFTPLKTDLDSYVLPEECECEAELGCPKCRAVLTMDVESTGDTITVYSGDLVPDDPNTAPASDKIVLAKLAEGQAIRFEAYAQLGQGKVHAKWTPTSMCVYQNVSVIPITDKAKAEDCVGDCGDAAVIEGDNLKIIDIQKFDSCKRCRELVPHEQIIENLKEDEFLFTVESTGALPPQRIVTEAVKILKKKLATLSEKVEKDELHDEINDFEVPEVDEGKLYSVGSGDFDEDEDGEAGDDFTGGIDQE